MSERPTPETDAAELVYDGKLSSGYADVDVCRKLERERDEAREIATELAQCLTVAKREGFDPRLMEVCEAVLGICHQRSLRPM